MAAGFQERWLSKVGDYTGSLAAEPKVLGEIREQSDRHREEHGRECDVYPSSPEKGRFLHAIIEATRARRILEIGCGLGYSATWMALALERGGHVDTVESDRKHADLARANFARAGVADRVRVFEGHAESLLPSFHGAYDLVFEDAAYGRDPPYREHMVRLARVGGVLITSNWFSLESYLGGKKDNFAKAGRRMRTYADRLFRDPRLVGVLIPWVWWGFITKIRE